MAGQDLLCFSHLRWDFVFQRPQHLLVRAARSIRVWYIEDAEWHHGIRPHAVTRTTPEGVVVVVPQLPHGVDPEGYLAGMRMILAELMIGNRIERPILWYYTPHALDWTEHLVGNPTVYDCMDELSAFRYADPGLPARERALMARAAVVFTGGHSLYEAKRTLHRNVHAMPSGVDTSHFAPARTILPEPADHAAIPHPRVGFYGVIDERLDTTLLAEAAALRPEVHFILVGPVAKIDPADLPQAPNLHWLGSRAYAELPATCAHWDAAMMPFALNQATRYISPTKTPEYLAAGLAVVSTPIADVVATYGGLQAVHIAADAQAFAAGIDAALAQRPLPETWRPEADRAIAAMGWDSIWSRMHAQVHATRRAPGILRRAEYDHVVVGAGFAGSVLAERLAAGSGRRVLLVDRRPHIGGNAHDAPDAAGILIHPYGPHIFHTNSEAVMDYLSRFTAWRPYEHRVLARVPTFAGCQLLPIPINRTTVNRFFGVDLAEAEVAAFLGARAVSRVPVRTSADVVLGAVGRELYEAFFQGYTRKQWGLDPSELDKSVTARVPTRTNDDDRYFTDRFQAMPRDGYTAMFRRMLHHPNIEVALETEWQDVGSRSPHMVFTGPVDEYFGHRHGRLPYRSLRFEHETLEVAQALPVGVVNEPDPAVPYTRTTEFKHLTGQVHAQTSLCREYPTAEGDPYYPVPRPENADLYRRYQALADATDDVTFVGRLATYKYYNMDQVVAQALSTWQKLMNRTQATMAAE